MNTKDIQLYPAHRQRAEALYLLVKVKSGFLVPQVESAVCAVVRPVGGIVRRKAGVLS